MGGSRGLKKANRNIVRYYDYTKHNHQVRVGCLEETDHLFTYFRGCVQHAYLPYQHGSLSLYYTSPPMDQTPEIVSPDFKPSVIQLITMKLSMHLLLVLPYSCFCGFKIFEKFPPPCGPDPRN